VFVPSFKPAFDALAVPDRICSSCLDAECLEHMNCYALMLMTLPTEATAVCGQLQLSRVARWQQPVQDFSRPNKQHHFD
jgi:hypothetical protein